MGEAKDGKGKGWGRERMGEEMGGVRKGWGKERVEEGEGRREMINDKFLGGKERIA